MTTTTSQFNYPTDTWRMLDSQSATAYQIASNVLKAFDEGVGRKLFDTMLEDAEKRAREDHERFLQGVQDGECSTQYRGRNCEARVLPYRLLPKYTLATLGMVYKISEQQEKIRWFKVNVEAAKNDALEVFAMGRAKFFLKIAGKLDKAFNGLDQKVENVDLTLMPHVPVTGSLKVRVEEGTSFTMRISIKDNYRYDTGTSYWQYPGTFHNAFVKGEKVSGPSLDRVAKAMAAAYGIAVQEAQEAPKSVEPTKKNLKALATLIDLRREEAALQANAEKRSRRGYSYGTRGPQAQISRNCNLLGLDKATTAEQAKELLLNSLPQEAKDRVKQIVGNPNEIQEYGRVQRRGMAFRGKRGSVEAEMDKLLKYLELATTGQHGTYPDFKDVTILSKKGERLFGEEA
jgi:hypothetical protein